MAAFITAEDPRWLHFLEQLPHSAYHLPAYLDVIASYLQGRALAFLGEVDGASCLIPLVERPLPSDVAGCEGRVDACSPPPYGGPVFRGAGASWPKLVELFRQACAHREIETVYLRNSPLLEPPWDLPPESGTVLAHGETVFIDLAPSEEELWARTSSRRRRGIRRAEKEGYRASIDDWSSFSAFRAIYDETMDRHEASPFWRFSDAYFDDLREKLGGRIHLCTVRASSGEVAAAGLYIVGGRSLEYHLGGTAEAHRAAGPSHLLYDQMRRWAKAQGLAVFHLGGGLPPLMEFKGGFSAARGKVHSLRLIPDLERYAELLRLCGIDAPPDGSSGFFPAYRGPE